jgi:hypothetical protein
MGDRTEARRLYEEVLAAQMVQLGPRHTSTLKTKLNLANLLAQLGELGGAQSLFEEVVAGFTQQIGPEHPVVKMAARSLARVQEMIGQQEPPNSHLGISCDGCGQYPVVGVRHKRSGDNFDRCSQCYSALEPAAQVEFTSINPPGPGLSAAAEPELEPEPES